MVSSSKIYEFFNLNHKHETSLFYKNREEIRVVELYQVSKNMKLETTSQTSENIENLYFNPGNIYRA